MSTFKKFYRRHHGLVDSYSVAVSALVTNLIPFANKINITAFNYWTFVSYQIFMFSAL